MSFAMSNWCKQGVLLIIVAIFNGVLLPCFAAEKGNDNTVSNRNYLENNHNRQFNLLAQKSLDCQKINPVYQEVYSFETESYYINICQIEDSFYYYRQSKQDPQNQLLIPAQAVFGGDVFQATDGKTNYFIGQDGDRYYSSVMSNDNEIVFEPQLSPPVSIFSNNIAEKDNIAVNNVSTGQTEENVATEQSDLAQENSLICAKDTSASNPHLNDWQNLLGKSPDTANEYAVNNGHDFVYSDREPDLALIETKEGTVINLNIATTSETIEQVCVQPIAENVRLDRP